MITFKKMWNDVEEMIASGLFNVEEKFPGSFVIKDEEGKRIFLTKEDFVDIWCRLLYYKEITLENKELFDKQSQKHVFNIMKKLPYISQNGNTLKLTEI